MRREELQACIRALRDLDRMEGHQPLADLVAREFKNRRSPGRRCPNCFGPLDGWMAAGGTRVVWCKLCTTFEEASAHLSSVIGPAPKTPRTWQLGWRAFSAGWSYYDPGYDYERVLHVSIGRVVLTIGWL